MIKEWSSFSVVTLLLPPSLLAQSFQVSKTAAWLLSHLKSAHVHQQNINMWE